MQLSILICSLESRREQLNSLLNTLLPQIGHSYNEQSHDFDFIISKYTGPHAEVIICIDNKAMSVGAKRNKLLKEARGNYVVFIDDDDKISGNYCAQLLLAMKDKPDVIVFNVFRFANGVADRGVMYGMEFNADSNTKDIYYRLPNHLMCVKREHALATKFKDVSFGEDADYAKRLRPLLKTQYRIEETLYEYWFDDKKTETARK